jgi:hypothetical protein
MDAEAKDQGKSGWLELMVEQSPEMADILKRMIQAELAAKRAGHKRDGCNLCEADATVGLRN